MTAHPYRSLADESLSALAARIEDVTAGHRARYPGDLAGRQPVHTVYVPADRFAADTTPAYGREALRLLSTHVAAPSELAAVAGVEDPATLERVHDRVERKLAREPVEDVRIDFEDGYGARDDADEDRDAGRAAIALASALADGSAPAFHGLRVKSFADGQHRRSIRTLDIFLTTLLDRVGTVPSGFVVTFPKVIATEHVAAFAELLARFEAELGLPAGALGFEVQIETTQSIFDEHGGLALARYRTAADGRLRAAHFGVFDYTAACGLPADEQRLDHPACDFARHVMQVTLAGTGVRLSDGSTNIVPADDTPSATLTAWRLHAAHVRHSLRHGFYQGWDLHPAQLVSRFTAVYAFLLADLDAVVGRVRRWAAGRAADGGVLDEPATVAALLAKLRRAVDSGAVEEPQLLDAAGIDAETLWARPR